MHSVRHKKMLAGTILMALLCARPGRAEDAMKVHVIDVGQGSATLVEFPCAAILIDTGGERSPAEEWKSATFDGAERLAQYLAAFFARRGDLHGKLEALYLTHPHIDHTRGAPQVIEAYKPENVVFNGQLSGSGRAQQELARDYASEDGVHGWYVLQRKIGGNGQTNRTIDPIGSCDGTDPRITVLWGRARWDDDWENADFDDENNHSLVIRIDYGDASLLVTGDLEERSTSGTKAGIERLLERFQGAGVLDVDVYLVGHHGSHNGTTRALVDAMSPEIAVVSAGPACKRPGYSAYQHGHPRRATIEDLERGVSGSRSAKAVKVFDRYATPPTTMTIDKAIYSTGWDGTVVLTGKPDGTWEVATGTVDGCLGG